MKSRPEKGMRLGRRGLLTSLLAFSVLVGADTAKATAISQWVGKSTLDAVRDFGADPTKTADSATAFNNWISVMTAGGFQGKLILPGGQFKIGSSLTFPTGTQGIVLEGGGATFQDPLNGHGATVIQNQTVLHWAGAAGGTMITGVGQLGLTMRNLTLNGQITSGANRCGLFFECGYDVTAANGSGEGIVEGCSFYHATTCYQMGTVSTDNDGADWLFHKNQYWDIDVCLRLFSSQNVNFNSNSQSFVNCGAAVLGILGGSYKSSVDDWFGCGFGNSATTSAFTGVIDNGSGSNGHLLTVTSHTGASLVPGMTVVGAGVNAGAYIVSQNSGTTGGNGVYTLAMPASIDQHVTSESMSAGYYFHTLVGMADGSETFTIENARPEGGSKGFANLQGGQAHAVFINFAEAQSSQTFVQVILAGVIGQFVGGRLASNDPTHAAPFVVVTTGAGAQMGGVQFNGTQFDGSVTTWDIASWIGRTFGSVRASYAVENCTYGANGNLLKAPNNHSHLQDGPVFLYVQATTNVTFQMATDGGGSAGYFAQAALPNDATTTFRATFILRKSDGSVAASFVREVVFNNVGGDFGATNAVLNSQTIGTDYNPSSWAISPAIVAGNGGVYGTVAGIAATTLNCGLELTMDGDGFNP